MKSGHLAATGHLEGNRDGTDAQQAHLFIHIIIPPGADGIGDGFLVATDWGGLGLDGRSASVGDVAANNGLSGFRLVSLRCPFVPWFGCLAVL